MKASIELKELSRKTLNRIAMETMDPDVLDKIVQSTRSEIVLTSVARNPKTRKGTIRLLSQSKNERVRNAALKNLAEPC